MAEARAGDKLYEVNKRRCEIAWGILRELCMLGSVDEEGHRYNIGDDARKRLKKQMAEQKQGRELCRSFVDYIQNELDSWNAPEARSLLYSDLKASDTVEPVPEEEKQLYLAAFRIASDLQDHQRMVKLAQGLVLGQNDDGFMVFYRQWDDALKLAKIARRSAHVIGDANSVAALSAVIAEIRHESGRIGPQPEVVILEDKVLEQVDRGTLRQVLAESFSQEELRNLCQDLQVDYEDLPDKDNGKSALAREMIAHLDHRKRIPELVRKVLNDRPTAWMPLIGRGTPTKEAI